MDTLKRLLTPRVRGIVLNLVRLAISAGLLAWIITQAGVEALAQAVRQGDAGLYVVALLVAMTGIVLRAWRWQVLLRSVGVRASFRRVVYLYYVGAFFNTFLPTGFGGDVVRVLEFGRGASSQQAAGTVLVDRLAGFVALFWMALALLPFSFGLLPPATVWLVGLAAAGVTLGSLLLFEGRVLRWLTRWLPGPLSLAGQGWLARTYGVITACGTRAILGALGISALFNVAHIAGIGLAGRALGLSVPFWTYFLFIPVATAALLVPVSISGFGVREGIFVALFGQVGLSAPQAVALSLASYSLDLADGLLGGAIYFAAGAAGLRTARG